MNRGAQRYPAWLRAVAMAVGIAFFVPLSLLGAGCVLNTAFELQPDSAEPDPFTSEWANAWSNGVAYLWMADAVLLLLVPALLVGLIHRWLGGRFWVAAVITLVFSVIGVSGFIAAIGEVVGEG